MRGKSPVKEANSFEPGASLFTDKKLHERMSLNPKDGGFKVLAHF
jgi:hypothetical protein